MLRTQVTSSNVASMAYDSKSRILEVEFKGGEIYHYFDAPVSVWTELRRRQRTGESIGKYLNSHVKGIYQFKKIS